MVAIRRASSFCSLLSPEAIIAVASRGCQGARANQQKSATDGHRCTPIGRDHQDTIQDSPVCVHLYYYPATSWNPLQFRQAWKKPSNMTRAGAPSLAGAPAKLRFAPRARDPRPGAVIPLPALPQACGRGPRLTARFRTRCGIAFFRVERGIQGLPGSRHNGQLARCAAALRSPHALRVTSRASREPCAAARRTDLD